MDHSEVIRTHVTTLLRLPQVIKATGRSRASIYGDIKAGVFPSPVPIGLRAVGWPTHEVDEINRARIAGKTPDVIRALVQTLEAKRKAA